jgi:arsenite methyltransferase
VVVRGDKNKNSGSFKNQFIKTVLRTLPSPPMSPETALSLSPCPTADSLAAGPAVGKKETSDSSVDSLFEHFAWIYIFCREWLFRDDTERMISAVWPNGKPAPGEKLLELGCGPGFYSCALAERFREIDVLGVDRSPSQLTWAREKAHKLSLNNGRFEHDNVLALSHGDNSFDVVMASRLFTVLPDRAHAVEEMYRVLRPGGRCFIAEPRYALWASIPLFTMWLLAGVTRYKNGYREPSKARVLSRRELNRLFASQPWAQMKTWQDGRYQYALCKKG